MTVLLIGATCVFMNVLIGYSGRHYMDSIGSYISGSGETDRGEPEYFDPEQKKLDEELTIVVHGAQESFITTNWYITAVVTVFGGVLAYFLSGKGSAEQSDRYEDHRRCPAGIPAIQPVVQSDA